MLRNLEFATHRRDLETIISLYAPDAVSMSAGDPPEHGAEAIRAAWKPLLATPGFSLRIIPEKIDLARSGEMAIELGHNDVEM
jgi:ketosteroid isomerase-like protein